jgi:hypothetical protein
LTDREEVIARARLIVTGLQGTKIRGRGAAAHARFRYAVGRHTLSAANLGRSMIHFFIDTNVLLSFYAFTQDDLTRLERLADEVDAGRFVVLTTEHVRNEFSRNRDNKIAETLKRFQEMSRAYSKLHGQLLKRLTQDARDRALKADQLIERFFEGATTLKITPEVVAKARLRGELNNPPGKSGSIGDAVNWELLLDYNPDDRLFFVTDDGDFYSALDHDQPLEFLTSEWARVVGAPIGFVHRLSELPEEVPHEVLPVEDVIDDERDELVSALIESPNFSVTHRLIFFLRRFPSFTARQVRGLVAALDNTQVGWISEDDDVFDFYTWLMDSHESLLTDDDLALLRNTFTPRVVEPTPDLPF